VTISGTALMVMSSFAAATQASSPLAFTLPSGLAPPTLSGRKRIAQVKRMASGSLVNPSYGFDFR
jgi:hypothetical protein